MVDLFPPPYWSAPGARLYCGDALAVLRTLPSWSVHCVVTSPPYWGLRDYGTGEWEGGSAECDHVQKSGNVYSTRPEVRPGRTPVDGITYKDTCGKCGAQRTDQQLGAEPSPDCGTQGRAQCGACYVCNLVGVIREVRRVMRDDANCWLNLGDSFSSGGQLVGVPWRVALALQADGWVLRNDVIWYSPNKMPESVTNRCTKSHEHIFLLTKGMRYYYDSIAIEEDTVSRPHAPGRVSEERVGQGAGGMGSSILNEPDKVWGADGLKNKRDVWVVPTRSGGAGGHFATYSPQLITPCILAGTSECGACARCGTPYERVVEREQAPPEVFTNRSAPVDGKVYSGSIVNGVWRGQGQKLQDWRDAHPSKTVGWRKVCACVGEEVVRCIVLDPFVGSGTTVATAIDLGRHGVGIDLSAAYLTDLAVPRVEAALRGEGAAARRKAKVVASNWSPNASRPPVERMRGVEED